MSETGMTAKQITDQCDLMMVTIAKLHEQIVALKRRAEGVNPVRDALAFYDATWMARYTAPLDVHYEFNRTVDPATMKRWMKHLDLEALKGRITRYFADNDEFLVRHKHPFNFFIKNFNVYSTSAVPSSRSSAPQEVADCAHVPRCGSDVQHTTRRMDDLRGEPAF